MKTCLLLAVSALCVLSLSARAEKPNIVVVVIDDMGWNDIGYHNPAMVTPHLDRFAEEGVRFNRFYVTPVCSPTRAGLLSGRYPIRYNMQNGVCPPHSVHGMPPKEFTIAEMLAQCGYRERLFIGKWHLGHRSTVFHPLNQGFTEFYGHYNGAIDYFSHERAGELDWHHNYDACYDEGYTTDLNGKKAVEFIRKNAKGDAPFLLYVSFNGVHSPVQAKEEDMKVFGFDPEKPCIVSDDAGLAKREKAPAYGDKGRPNDLRQGFKALALAVDRAFGNMMSELEKQGIADNTLVLFTSDNGGVEGHGGSNKPLRAGKFTTFEGGVRVPAALQWPAQISGGRTLEAMLSYVDLLPTLAEVAGFAGKWPNQLDGQNMLEVIKGNQSPPDRYVYIGAHSGGAVANKRWKLVKNALFDLENDLYEKENMAEKYPEVFETMREKLAEFNALRGPYTVSTVEYETFPPPEWKIKEESGEGESQEPQRRK